MTNLFALVCRALVIALLLASIGLIANLASDAPIPWVYSPQREIILAGVTVQLINERDAIRFFDDPETVFIDSRKCDDYARSHIKGAICLPPDDVEQRFFSVENLMPPQKRLILYCYGPECDMAERVGTFLARMGHKNMMIRVPVFRRGRSPSFQ